MKKKRPLIDIPIKEIIENLIILGYKVAYDLQSNHIEVWDKRDTSVTCNCIYRSAYEHLLVVIKTIKVTINCHNQHQIAAIRALICSILDRHLHKYIEVESEAQ